MKGIYNIKNKTEKVPYVCPYLIKRFKRVLEGEKIEVKTTKRASHILPDFVGHTILVHNGKKFIALAIKSYMVFNRLGEYVLTRKAVIHPKTKVVKSVKKETKKK